uniref:Uncharacterized protein n=1 Tax=Rhizophora mucronata TaxID=61149 RepID=A0A2P2QFV9_RHIMU
MRYPSQIMIPQSLTEKHKFPIHPKWNYKTTNKAQH